MSGPLRNFLSGLASSPIGRSFEQSPLTKNLGTKALAKSPIFTGASAQIKTLPGLVNPGAGFSTSTPKLGAALGSTGDGPSSLGGLKAPTWQPFQQGMSSTDIAATGLTSIANARFSINADIANEFGGQMGDSFGGDGTVTSLGGDWAKVDKLNPYILEAAAKHNVDPNLIKAVMKLESGGEWIISHAGAIGYMQVVPKYWGHLGYNLNDPRENILAGAAVLKYYLDKNGGNVHEALRAYHGYGFDGFSTDMQYADRITGMYQSLGKGSAGSSMGGGSLGSNGWNTIFGGKSFAITQEMGLNSFSQQHLNGMYAYATAYGVTGHAGIDVGTPRGTALRAPMDGTVIRAGGSGYYCDTSGCGPGKGELKLKLSDGSELILGHMASIGVSVGQKVTAGQVVGMSGTMNGDHVHVEYRVKDSSTSSGWRAVDPRGVVGGGGSSLGVAGSGGSGWATMGGSSLPGSSWTSFSPFSAAKQSYNPFGNSY